MCGNGGECIDCDSCPRTFCLGCIQFSNPKLAKDPLVKFFCPHCHINSPERQGVYLVSNLCPTTSPIDPLPSALQEERQSNRGCDGHAPEAHPSGQFSAYEQFRGSRHS